MRPIKTKIAKLAWGEGTVMQRGDKWRIRWREDGCQQSETHKTEEAAKDALKHIAERLRHGLEGKAVPAPKPVSLQFADLVPDWIEYRKAHGIRSANEDLARWNKHLAKPLSAMTIDTVTALTVRAIAQELVKPTVGSKKSKVSGPTAHRAITLLSAFYTYAIDQGLTSANPARQALTNKDTKKLLQSKHNGKAAPYLRSRAEVTQLYQAISRADSTVGVAYAISAQAGLRPGEVIALDWASVDLTANVLTVSKQARSGKLGPTKSGKPREAPINTELATILTAWCQTQQAALGQAFTDSSLVCPPPSRKLKSGKPGKSYGRFLGAKSIREAMDLAFAELGWKPMSLYESGRHTFGSLAGLGGISTWRLQDIMGHQDISTTQRYVSLADQALSSQELAALGG